MKSPSDVSFTIVVPCRNEVGNVPGLLKEIIEAVRGRQAEIIVVDDGSDDGTGNAVMEVAEDHSEIRLLRHDRASGQSAAILSGLQAARGEIVVTIDGDGQNDPAYIPLLLDGLEASGETTKLAAGQRVGRKASLLKKIGSRLANTIRRGLLKDGTHDTGCGLKAIRRDVFLRLPYFDGWHRYFAALVAREGYTVTYIDVVDRPRMHGVSKYGIFDRLWVGIGDLLGVWWLVRRRWTRPTVSEVIRDD